MSDATQPQNQGRQQSTFDLIVLGLGPGGEEVAERMAEAGWSVLGVDDGLVGGECPYYGCVPSKMIIRGAEVLAEGRRVNRLSGLATVTPDFTPVARRIRDEATDNWNDRVAVERFENLGGTFTRGTGRLAGRDQNGLFQVIVGNRTYAARRGVVIGVGTAPAIPPIDGLRELRAEQSGIEGPIWTNREAVQAHGAPRSLTVLGGGAIGIELAQAFVRFGTDVTVVEALDRILSVDEPEASQTVSEVLEREGVTIRTGAKVTAVAPDTNGVQIALDDGQKIAGEKLLVSVGRRSNLATVALELVGLDPRSRVIEIDRHMQVIRDGAPIDGLYAIGDVTGHGAFTHVSVWQARVLIAHLLGKPEPFGGYHGLAWTTFTDPEVGRVGMTEQQARDAGLRVRIGKASIAASARGWIHGPGNDGFVKLVEDADRGVLVGATVVSPYGGEILGLLTLAVHAEVPIGQLATMHYVYPTLHRTILDAVISLTS